MNNCHSTKPTETEPGKKNRRRNETQKYTKKLLQLIFLKHFIRVSCNKNAQKQTHKIYEIS